MNKVLLVISLISILLLAGCNKNENIKNNNLQENTNNQQEVIVDSKNEISKNKLDLSAISTYFDLINQYLAEKQEIYKDEELDNYKFDLIYFNNDDILDLLVTRGISYVYTLENGKLKTLVEGYSYGTWGRSPSYAPKMSLIKDSTYDMEGNTYTEYFDMNGKTLEDANVYSIKTNVLTGEITTDGKLDIELPKEDEFLELIGSKSAIEIKAELLGKSAEKIEQESKNALIIGNEKYEKATSFYSSGLAYENETVPVADYIGYKITNINEVKALFTDEKFDKYVGRT